MKRKALQVLLTAKAWNQISHAASGHPSLGCILLHCFTMIEAAKRALSRRGDDETTTSPNSSGRDDERSSPASPWDSPVGILVAQEHIFLYHVLLRG